LRVNPGIICVEKRGDTFVLVLRYKFFFCPVGRHWIPVLYYIIDNMHKQSLYHIRLVHDPSSFEPLGVKADIYDIQLSSVIRVYAAEGGVCQLLGDIPSGIFPFILPILGDPCVKDG